MRRTLTVGYTAAADAVAYTVDRETELVGALVHRSFVLSQSPSDTVANVITSNATKFSSDVIAASAASTSNPVHIPLSFKLRQGDVIYCSYAAAGSLVLFFSDPE